MRGRNLGDEKEALAKQKLNPNQRNQNDFLHELQTTRLTNIFTNSPADIHQNLHPKPQTP